MRVINNEGFARLKGSLDECFKISKVVCVDVIITITRGGVVSLSIVQGALTDILQCIINNSIWSVVLEEIRQDAQAVELDAPIR